MRIAIFEWICGGGMHAIPVSEIPDSLATEGRAMLECLLKSFADTNCSVVTVCDSRLVDPASIDLVDCQVREFSSSVLPVDLTAQKCTLDTWMEIAATCDAALIVAPEIDGILQGCVASMKAAGIKLLNCSEEFLRLSSSKFLTAEALIKAGIDHPQTFSAHQFLKDALGQGSWCIKSDFGAGCDGLLIGSAKEICNWLRDNASRAPNPSAVSLDAIVVQPWLPGQPYSCSAIVDGNGNPFWMPLVTQRFTKTNCSNGLHSLVYQGGEVLSTASDRHPPIDLLNRTLQALNSNAVDGALGWIGVDLLLEDSGKWVVIEVNPRLTTSVIGLTQAAPINLAEVMLQAFSVSESPKSWQIDWKPIQFRASSRSLN